MKKIQVRIPAATVCHHAPGRIRLRIPSRRRDSAYFSKVLSGLRSCKEIDSLEVNANTASVLVLYKRDDPKTIFSFAEGSHLFYVVETPSPSNRPKQRSLAESVSRALRVIDRGIKSKIDVMDLRSAAVLSLAALGTLQIFRGNWLSPASTLFSDAIKWLPSPPRGSHARPNRR